MITNKIKNKLSSLPFALCLLSFYILNSTFCIAEVRYVSPTGNNIPPYLSWEDAANKIQDAIDVCVNGDTIYVANGVYKENLVINTQIALIGSSMDSTVINGNGLGDFTVVFNASGSIENFNIYGKGEGTSGTRIIWSTTQFILIDVKNCKISEAGGGIACVSSSLRAENLFIEKVIIGFSLFSGNVANFYLSNCIFIGNQENSQGVTIGFASQADVHIANNIILFTGTINPGSGISIGAPRKVYIYNNLISRFSRGIYFDNVIDTAFVKNNVFVYQNSSNAAAIRTLSNRIFINNVVFSKNYWGIDGSGSSVISDYNLYWENLNDLDGLTYGDSDRVANPMFVKDTLPNPQMDFDYHLQAYSPAIDKGDPDILDVDGSRSDIGMFGGPLGEKYTYMDLAPKPPANLTAVYQSNAIHLNWNKNTEADLSHYRIYRDTVPNFIYDISKMIGETEDTTFTDILPDPNKAKNYYYKITAFDNQENQSAASEEVHVIVTGLGEIPPQVVEEYKLLNNYPNPFNPSTTIPYRLKEAGYVKIMFIIYSES